MSRGPVRTFALTFVFATLVACRSEPSTKPPKPTASVAPVASSAPAEPASAATAVEALAASAPASGAAPAASAAASARKSIKETIGTVVKIEVSEAKHLKLTKKMDLTKQADVDALLAAIGTDQVPNGSLRRCPDEVVVAMQDASGTVKGSVGFCLGDANLGAEFFTGPGYDERKGFKLADAAAVRKALELEE